MSDRPDEERLARLLLGAVVAVSAGILAVILVVALTG